MSNPAVSAMRKTKVRGPASLSAGNHVMPSRTGITPTYRPISVKLRSVRAFGRAVDAATGMLVLKAIELDENSVMA